MRFLKKLKKKLIGLTNKNKEVYFYSVGYYSYEDSAEIVLINKKFYTESQFKKLCLDISLYVYNNRIRLDHEEWGIKHHAREPESKDHAHLKRFDWMYSHVVNVLCKSYGFKVLKKTAMFSPFGWAQIDDEYDWASERQNDNDLMLLQKKITRQRILLIEKIKKNSDK